MFPARFVPPEPTTVGLLASCVEDELERVTENVRDRDSAQTTRAMYPNVFGGARNDEWQLYSITCGWLPGIDEIMWVLRVNSSLPLILI